MTDPHPFPHAPFRRIGLVAKPGLHQASTLLGDIANWLQMRGLEVCFEQHTADLAPGPAGTIRDVRSRAQLPCDVDLIVVLGGDGTLLGMADAIAEANVPVPILGVNFGSLGFLTEITLDELYPALEAALSGQARVDERVMLRAETRRDGDRLGVNLVLNDVVVTRGALSRIIDLGVWADEQLVAHFKADGLIVATATGSTAYNLAAGGPILHPAVDAIVITPIAPHTLTNRPVVLPASMEIQIRPSISQTQEHAFVTFDGQTGLPLRGTDVVAIRRAPEPLRLLRASTRSYFDVLRQKLKWAER